MTASWNAWNACTAPSRAASRFQCPIELEYPFATRPRPASSLADSKLLRELGVGAVPHGFRSSFRDWAAECSDAPREFCELALAHVNSDRVEAAYRHSDLFERRREVIQAWANYVEANV